MTSYNSNKHQRHSQKQQQQQQTGAIDLASHLAKNKHHFADEENQNNKANNNDNSNNVFDEYGRGAPTDRLIFGYAPSVTAEAVAFHSRFSNKQWKIERRLRFKNRCLRPRQVFLQEQAAVANGQTKKEGLLNFESDISAIKLRLYWIEKLEEERKFLQGNITQQKNNNSSEDNQKQDNGTEKSAKNEQQQNNKKEGGFGKLLADMFGGEITNEAAKEGGKRRQRE